MSLKIFLNGAKGRMGQAIQFAAKDMGITFCGLCDVGDEHIARQLEEADVVLDFSFHSATLPLAKLAAEYNKPLVIGTTGHTEEEKREILKVIQGLPVVWAGNYSVGVNVLNWLTAQAARILDSDFQAEVLELHHALKKDAPSGTAERLVEIIREKRNTPEEKVVRSREGLVGERAEGEIGVQAIRGGGIVGEHTVYFIGKNERLELTHRAADRSILAEGSLKACQWICGKTAGLYNMEDILGLRG